MPRTPNTRTQRDYVMRRKSTSTSLPSTSAFDDEGKDPNFNLSPDTEEDTNGVAPLGGNIMHSQ
jgi:hypothetical protein